jgi:DNA-binding NarL/FixJ family response regulator
MVMCIEAGAGGYTCYGASAAEVAAAIRSIRQGTAVCTPDVTARVFARLEALGSVSAQPLTFKAPLTARELEILGYIAQDYSNQAIAELLVIEVCTVKHHIHNILEKLQLRHRHEAARYASDRGWLNGACRTHPPARSSRT